MASPNFRFKLFTVWHDHCAMKVGTDGVLLGAWAQQKHARTILDIGTGSGLIALMLAQRFQEAEITGIDIDPSAAKQASDNFRLSPWSHRMHARCIDLHTFSLEDGHFDLIVSNPPYFSASLKNPNQQRATARHVAQLFQPSAERRRTTVRHPARRPGQQFPSHGQTVFLTYTSYSMGAPHPPKRTQTCSPCLGKRQRSTFDGTSYH